MSKNFLQLNDSKSEVIKRPAGISSCSINDLSSNLVSKEACKGVISDSEMSPDTQVTKVILVFPS